MQWKFDENESILDKIFCLKDPGQDCPAPPPYKLKRPNKEIWGAPTSRLADIWCVVDNLMEWDAVELDERFSFTQ